MRLLLASLVVLTACTSPEPEARRRHESRTLPTIEYDVTLSVDPAEQLVSGRAVLENVEGAVVLEFPERYAFALVEPRFVAEPEARSIGEDDIRIERIDAYRWRIVDADPEADRFDRRLLDPIEVTWSIRIDHREVEAVVAASDQYEHSYLAEDHGMLATPAVMPVPMRSQPVSPRVRFELPDGWDEIVPWEEREPGVYGPDEAGLNNDLVALGAWDRIDGEADGLEYTIALAPGQDELAEIVAERLPPIVEAEVELFGGAPQPKYLFLFGRPDTPASYGGSPKSNAMTMSVSPNMPPETVADGVAHLVAHEFHHTWMRARCRPEDELRFVVEGFTDYFAYLVPWRLGMTTDEEFAQTLGEKLAEAEVALARYGGSLARAGGPDFFAGRDAYSACYSGGLALALWTDLAARSGGPGMDAFMERMERWRRFQEDDETRDPDRMPSLDDVMRRFYDDERWTDERRPSLADWGDRLREDLGEDLARVQLAAVEDPDGVDWTALFEEIEVWIGRRVTLLPPTPRANFDGTRVLLVDPAGAGAAAGLRVGDRIVEVNGHVVDDEPSLRRAWPLAANGRLRVTLERDGERVELDVREPTAPSYTVDPSIVLERLR